MCGVCLVWCGVNGVCVVVGVCVCRVLGWCVCGGVPCSWTVLSFRQAGPALVLQVCGVWCGVV